MSIEFGSEAWEEWRDRQIDHELYGQDDES